MVSSSRQSSAISPSLPSDRRESSAIQYHSDSGRSVSQPDLDANSSFKDKLNSGIKWFIDPFERCCSSETKLHQRSKNPFGSQSLKPEFNRVNGLLKYFTFGVMLTNGILGFILFMIGLWSSLENRKLSHMPSVTTKDSTSLNPFNFLGIILCIFGLVFFILCLISCLGINRENLNLLRISLIGQFLTVILFIITAIMILLWKERIRNKISEALIIGLKVHYHVDEGWTAFFNKLHMSYFCCGVYSFNDWNDNPHYACTASNMLQNFDACSVPYTCCKTEQKKNDMDTSVNSLVYTCGTNILPSDNLTINMNEIQERINVNGCFDEILPIIQQLIITASIFMLLICVIVFVTIFLTCFLIFEIRLTISDVQRYSRKKRRRDDETAFEKDDDNF